MGTARASSKMHPRDGAIRKPQGTGRRTIWRSLLQAIPSSIVVGITTFVCFMFHVNFPAVSFIYLIVVVLQSLTGDFRSLAFDGSVSPVDGGIIVYW